MSPCSSLASVLAQWALRATALSQRATTASTRRRRTTFPPVSFLSTSGLLETRRRITTCYRNTSKSTWTSGAFKENIPVSQLATEVVIAMLGSQGFWLSPSPLYCLILFEKQRVKWSSFISIHFGCNWRSLWSVPVEVVLGSSQLCFMWYQRSNDSPNALSRYIELCPMAQCTVPAFAGDFSRMYEPAFAVVAVC